MPSFDGTAIFSAYCHIAITPFSVTRAPNADARCAAVLTTPRGAPAPHSALTPAAFTTFAHLAISLKMNLPYS